VVACSLVAFLWSLSRKMREFCLGRTVCRGVAPCF
jgi:hypothetical protein